MIGSDFKLRSTDDFARPDIVCHFAANPEDSSKFPGVADNLIANLELGNISIAMFRLFVWCRSV